MIAPDKQAFLEDLETPDFKLGVLDSKWKLIKIEDDNPIAFIEVSAAPRANSPESYVFRFKIDNYPAYAPEICIWDIDNDCKLVEVKRPSGPDSFKILFRTNWENGDHLYAPYERIGLNTHPDWPSTYKDLCWKSGDCIVKILNDLYRQLQSDRYEGVK
jgi:hypothetical protein